MENILKELLAEIKEIKKEVQVIASNLNPKNVTINIETPNSKRPEDAAADLKKSLCQL